MEYLKWNDLIGDYFFCNEENLGKTIFLYIDKNLLIEFYKKKNTDNRADDDIWQDFINVLNNPIIRIDSFGRRFEYPFSAYEYSYRARLEKLIRWYSFNNRNAQSKYPIYLSFLILPIIAKAQERDTGVKNAVSLFFNNENNGILHDETDLNGANYLLKSICFTNDREDGGLWNNLHIWSLENGYGITYYNFVPTNDNNWKYVNMVMDQCLINANEKVRARALYDRAGLNVNSTYSFREFRNHLLAHRNRFGQYFDSSAARELRGNNSDGLFKVLYNDFQSWDGSFEEGENENLKKVQSHYIRLGCEVDRDNRRFTIQYRLKEKFDGSLRVFYNGNNHESVIRLEHGEWTTPLESIKIRVIEGTRHRNVFKFNPSDVYLLTKAKDFEGCVFVSRDDLLYEGNRVFFITQQEVGLLPNLVCLNYSNDEGYHLYRYDVNLNDAIVSEGGLLYRFVATDEDITNDKISLEGGLYINQRGTGNKGYLNQLSPFVLDEDFQEEIFICDCDNPTNRYSLTAYEHEETDDHKTWILPERLPSGVYNIENTRLRVSIIDSSNLQPPIINNHPFVKKDGTMSFENPNEICMIDNEIMCDFRGSYPQSYLCHGNTRLAPRNDEYDFTYGDYLIDWLYWNGECTREEFIKAYQFLQEKQESLRPTLKRLSKYTTPNAALRWLEKGGYLDIVNERSKIIPCSPRFIILPVTVNSCNKFRLIGCRSLSMLHRVREICRNHQEMFRFQIEQTSDDFLIERLTPSSIFVETTGSFSNDYGLQNINRYICNELNIKKPIVQYLFHFNQFVPKTTELNGNWEDFSANTPYVDCKCYIFNETDYEYDQSRFYLLNELFNSVRDYRLVKISLSTYRNDYVVLDGINQRYIKVNDESHAKMFVLYKNNPSWWSGRNNICLKKVNNVLTGYTDIYVAKRIDLPKALVRYLNFISITPPRINVTQIPGSNLRYYVYPIHDDLDITQIISILSQKTGTNLNPNSITI